MTTQEASFLLHHQIKDAVIMIDNDGLITLWNKSAELMFGYSKEEVEGKDVHMLLAPEKYHNDYKKGFAKFRDTGEGLAVGKTMEMEAIRKDGEEIQVELSVSAMKVHGKWNSLATIRDISTRKRAEEHLKKKEETYKLYLEAIPELIFEMDKEGRFLSFKPSKEINLFLAPDEFIGKKITETLPKEIAAETMVRLEQVFETGKYDWFEYNLPINNETRYFEARIVRASNEVALVIIQDTTNKKRLSLESQEAKEFRKIITRHVSDLVWITDLDFKTKFVSESVLKLRGFTVKEAIRQNIEEILCQDSLDLAKSTVFDQLNDYKKTKAKEIESLSIVLEMKCKDGATIWTDTKIDIIRDKEGLASGIVCISRDISDQVDGI
ncbi:MAG: PAS domain S-box protein [Pseudomonadota bacterium]